MRQTETGFSAGKRVFMYVCLLLVVCSLHAQNKPVVSQEIQHLEGLIKTASGAEKHLALRRLATLLRLSGDLEGAALSWTNAAYAKPGSRDDEALLEGALCFLGIGELEKAEANIQMVLISSRDMAIYFRSRYLGAQLDVFRSGDMDALTSLVDNPNFEEYRPGIYYTLWRLSGKDAYKNRLVVEYPKSPEALIVTGGQVREVPSPLWLLFPGREALSLSSPALVAASPTDTAAPQGSEGLSSTGGPLSLQVGYFASEQNARLLADRLRSEGFVPVIDRRLLNGLVRWAVLVSPGLDIRNTIARLKDKGFEYYLVD
jgi:hypothetical protein